MDMMEKMTTKNEGKIEKMGIRHKEKGKRKENRKKGIKRKGGIEVGGNETKNKGR